MGGSEYLKVVHQKHEGPIPTLDLEREKQIQSFVLQAIQKGWVKSAHDCSEGGLAVTLAECCITGPKPIGAHVQLESSIRADALLFGESQSRVILSISPNNREDVLSLVNSFQVPLLQLGTVVGEKLIISEWIDAEVDQLKKTWTEGFQKHLGL